MIHFRKEKILKRRFCIPSNIKVVVYDIPYYIHWSTLFLVTTLRGLGSIKSPRKYSMDVCQNLDRKSRLTEKPISPIVS